jgi:hypothetical protein
MLKMKTDAVYVDFKRAYDTLSDVEKRQVLNCLDELFGGVPDDS